MATPALSREYEKKRMFTAEMLLTIILASVPAVGNYFVFAYRIGEIEKRYDSEVVPRAEHNVRDQALYGKIDLMQHSLDMMNTRLEKISDNLEKR